MSDVNNDPGRTSNLDIWRMSELQDSLHRTLAGRSNLILSVGLTYMYSL